MVPATPVPCASLSDHSSSGGHAKPARNDPMLVPHLHLSASHYHDILSGVSHLNSEVVYVDSLRGMW